MEVEIQLPGQTTLGIWRNHSVWKEPLPAPARLNPDPGGSVQPLAPASRSALHAVGVYGKAACIAGQKLSLSGLNSGPSWHHEVDTAQILCRLLPQFSWGQQGLHCGPCMGEARPDASAPSVSQRGRPGPAPGPSRPSSAPPPSPPRPQEPLSGGGPRTRFPQTREAGWRRKRGRSLAPAPPAHLRPPQPPDVGSWASPSREEGTAERRLWAARGARRKRRPAAAAALLCGPGQGRKWEEGELGVPLPPQPRGDDARRIRDPPAVAAAAPAARAPAPAAGDCAAPHRRPAPPARRPRGPGPAPDAAPPPPPPGTCLTPGAGGTGPSSYA